MYSLATEEAVEMIQRAATMLGRYYREERYDPDPSRDKKTGRFTFKNGIDFSKNSGIIEIGKSLGASAKNYPVKLPDGNQHTKLVENQKIVGKAFAGKGTKTPVKERFRLETEYQIPADKWQKMSGNGKVIVDKKERLVELHWYEADGEVVEMKIKRYLDES